LNKGKVLHNF